MNNEEVQAEVESRGLKGKTIESIGVRSPDLWSIYFTDGTFAHLTAKIEPGKPFKGKPQPFARMRISGAQPYPYSTVMALEAEERKET